jgi:hypothetical protein
MPRAAVFASFLVLLGLQNAFGQALQPQVEVIGSYGGFQMTIPVATNNAGQVVGVVSHRGAVAGYSVFLWSRRDGFRIIAEDAVAADINNRGDVVGSWLECIQHAGGGASCPYHGFIWNARTGFRDLGEFTPAAVNNSGDMAGTCVNHSFGHIVPCAMHDGVLTVWECEITKEPCGGRATGINARGDVVGTFYYSDYDTEPVLWQRRGGKIHLGTGGIANDINDGGTIAGDIIRSCQDTRSPDAIRIEFCAP